MILFLKETDDVIQSLDADLRSRNDQNAGKSACVGKWEILSLKEMMKFDKKKQNLNQNFSGHEILRDCSWNYFLPFLRVSESENPYTNFWEKLEKPPQNTGFCEILDAPYFLLENRCVSF